VAGLETFWIFVAVLKRPNIYEMLPVIAVAFEQGAQHLLKLR
jgi:hypothetical protein